MNKTIQTPVSTGRYSIGEKLVGVSIIVGVLGNGDYPASKRSQCIFPFSVLSHKYTGPTSVSFNFKVFTVTEHHKVPSQWDDSNKCTCDGYYLQDEKGGLWLNQYPRASYGQISDVADALFQCSIPAGADVAAILNDWRNPHEYILLDRLLDDLTIGSDEKKKIIADINARQGRYGAGDLARMQHNAISVTKAFERALGDRFEIVDEEVFEGIFRKAVVERKTVVSA